MSIIINSGVPASASHESSLTTGTLLLNLPSGSAGAGSVQISDVIGLQTSLDGKLNDTNGPVGLANVFANGVDLNLMAGLSAFGLLQTDLQKLSQIDASAAELNFSIGVTSDIQTQIDANFGVDEFTAADQMLHSTGAGAGSVETIADVLSGAVGAGFEFGALKPATADLDFNAQVGVNAADPILDQDLATKFYVDNAVLGGGTFLPLGGGIMTGAIDMNGESIILDIDGDSLLSAAVDNTVVLDVASTLFTWTTTGYNMGGVAITNLLDPTAPQEAATKNYADITFMPLGGGAFTGSLDLDGNTLILDGDGDTTLSAAVDDVIVITIGVANTITIGTDIAVDGLDISGLPGTPVGATSAVSLAYADATYAQLGGSTLTGDLDLNGNILLNPLDPTDGTHVGDRDYSDARYFQISNDLSEGTAGTMRTNLGLALVAATGDYDDLINLPTIVVNFNDLIDVNTGAPGAGEDGHVVTWNDGASLFDLQPVAIVSVFSRTGVIISADSDYTASQIDNVAAGNIVAITVQAALNELDTNKVALDGSQAMSGDLDMGSNQMINLALPFVAGNHTFSSGDYQSTAGGVGFFISTSSTPSAAAPLYSFISDQDTGIWFDGSGVAISIGGTDSLIVGASTISAESNRLVNVADPTADQDAVTLSFLNARGSVRLLGSTTGVDLFGESGGTAFAIYTLPVGARHIITSIIVVPTSYVPGANPDNPVVSIGTSAANYDQIVATVALDWGGIAGAADQATYVDPDQGASTPNATETISLQLDTPAAGTFSALTVDIFVLGIEL